MRNDRILIAIFFLVIFVVLPQIASAHLSGRKEVRSFIHTMVSKHGFNLQRLNELFQQLESSEEVLKQISKPFETVSWGRYRRLFLTKERIKEGVNFWQAYQKTLEHAEYQFGVPIEIIISVIGIETFYGKYVGQYSVLQSLATLAFDYPKRSKFFLNELEQYLLLTREQQLPVELMKGSYAGAMGASQFISSSYRNYAIDFEMKGKVDLTNSIPNAIGSVANYLNAHGWKTQQSIVHKATKEGEKYKSLLIQNVKPTVTISALAQYGVHCMANTLQDSNTLVVFLELDNAGIKEYWLGRDNFYVITRYNNSVNYAMAVYELSQAISKMLNR